MSSAPLLGAQRRLAQPLARVGRTVITNGVTLFALRNSALISAVMSSELPEEDLEPEGLAGGLVVRR